MFRLYPDWTATWLSLFGHIEMSVVEVAERPSGYRPRVAIELPSIVRTPETVFLAWEPLR
jgi:hypothetical protein